jgi:hypothetical protein
VSVQVKQEIDSGAVQRALSDALGPAYKVNVTSDSTLKVSRSAVMIATVRMRRSGGITTFRVSSFGFLLGKLLNSLTIAPRVRHALSQAYPDAA